MKILLPYIIISHSDRVHITPLSLSVVRLKRIKSLSVLTRVLQLIVFIVRVVYDPRTVIRFTKRNRHRIHFTLNVHLVSFKTFNRRPQLFKIYSVENKKIK